MDANNINTGVSQMVDEFNWFKPTGNVHVEGVKISAPDFSIPPTPASSYSNLHVVLDHVHASTETITRGVLPPHSFTTGPYAGPSSRSVPSSSFTSTPVPSAPAFTSRDIPISSESTTLFDNKLDNVPFSSARAVPEPVNPELPGARSFDALTSLKSEIAPIQPPMVPLEEFDDMAERKDRKLPESVDLSLTDESQKWSDEWNKVGDDVRNKKWNLHHYSPERDSYWGKQWNTVGKDIKNKNWNLKRFMPLRSFKLNSWPMIDQLENAERQWRQSRGIDGLWSGRMNRVHHELLTFVAPIGWAQWFRDLKDSIASRSSQLLNSATNAAYGAEESAKDIANAAVADYDYVKDRAVADYEIAKDVTKDLANRAADTASADYEIAKDTAKDLANSVANTVAADYEIAKDAAKNIAGSVADSAVKAKDVAMDLANSATNAIADKVVDLTTTPIPKYNGALWTEYEFYVPQLPRRVPAEIIAMEEKERADRMSRGINPVVSGMWHRLGREMLHTYRDDMAELFTGLRLSLKKKGSFLVESAKDAINSLNTFKAPLTLAVPRGSVYKYEPINFDFVARKPFDIIAMEEKERADRMSHGVNPIVSGLWYRLGLELKYKYSIRPTLASTASMVAGVASDLAGMAAEKLSDLSGAVMEKSKELLTPAPVSDFAEHGKTPLNLFAYTAEPVDFTFKSRRCPAEIIAMEEKERAERIIEGVDALAYTKWNSLLSESHKTLMDAPSMASYIPTLASAKNTLVESGKGITGYFGSWAHSMADKAASYIDAAKHSQVAEAAMEYVHPDPSSISSINKAEELERTRRMTEAVDPMLAARLGRVQEELLQSIRSV